MKRERMVILLFAVLLAAIPVVPALLLSQHTSKSESESAAEQSKAADDLPDFSVLDVSTGEVLAVSARDYVIGAVCAEMPATFEPEALKAQAVAAHTYAVRQQLLEQENPTPELIFPMTQQNIRRSSRKIRQNNTTGHNLTPIMKRLQRL